MPPGGRPNGELAARHWWWWKQGHPHHKWALCLHAPVTIRKGVCKFVCLHVCAQRTIFCVDIDDEGKAASCLHAPGRQREVGGSGGSNLFRIKNWFWWSHTSGGLPTTLGVVDCAAAQKARKCSGPAYFLCAWLYILYFFADNEQQLSLWTLAAPLCAAGCTAART